MKVLIPWLMVLSLLTATFVPAAMAQSDGADSLVGTQWQLVSYGEPGTEKAVILDSHLLDGRIKLKFETDNQVTGSTGCNGYTSSYTIEVDTITFSQLAQTVILCVEIAEQEQTYLEALRSTERFEIKGDQLTFQYEDGQYLNFVRLDPSIGQFPFPFEDLESPVELLASYYNAINRQDYQRAYAYWEAPPSSYDDFVNGFADTTSIQLIVQPPTRYDGAAGSLYAAIPTVLIAQHTDSTQLTYAGCFVTRKPNLSPPDLPQKDVWHLYSTDIVQVSDDSAIPTLLSEACEL